MGTNFSDYPESPFMVSIWREKMVKELKKRCELCPKGFEECKMAGVCNRLISVGELLGVTKK
jgi:hypothetical protein